MLFDKVPKYVFLTGFSQLISRICHPHTNVWTNLKYILVGLITAHPHQSLWMMMAVSKVAYIYNYINITLDVPPLTMEQP